MKRKLLLGGGDVTHYCLAHLNGVNRKGQPEGKIDGVMLSVGM